MVYGFSPVAFVIFATFVAAVLAISFYLGAKAKSAKGYFAAHGQIPWFINGIAFAGDYLSAASFLGICGLIAFYGYDGFLYSIGYLAGWIVALFVIAEPIKRLGRFTFADALDSRFNSRGIKLSVAISTLVVSIFYLIPQMVGAGALIRPLLGLPQWSGVLIVGVTVILIVVTAGMVSTTWVQFIKGSLLVLCCAVLVAFILNRGFDLPSVAGKDRLLESRHRYSGVMSNLEPLVEKMAGTPARLYRANDGSYWMADLDRDSPAMHACQSVTVRKDGTRLINGKPESSENTIQPVGTIAKLPNGERWTGPVGPLKFLETLQYSWVTTWPSATVPESDGSSTTVYYPLPRPGSALLSPGGYFKGLKSGKATDRLDFISLMLALFLGTASLPHILIRYYTVKDAAAARKSTVVGIAAIGVFYILTLYLGLGAMTSGALDPTDNNLAAPLLAKSFSNTFFAIISAVAFTTVLGTVSGLIMAASGAVAHDLISNVMEKDLDDHAKVKAGKIAAVFVGIIAMALGVAFQKLNVAFLVAWAFNVAASANLPALVMLLFWKRTTRQGIIAAVTVGMVASLGWILLSGNCYKDVYGLDPSRSIIPFSQPALVTVPLGFLTLIAVSLVTYRPKERGFPVTLK